MNYCENCFCHCIICNWNRDKPFFCFQNMNTMCGCPSISIKLQCAHIARAQTMFQILSINNWPTINIWNNFLPKIGIHTFKLHACSENFSIIDSIAHEFVETSNKNELIFDFDKNKDAKLEFDDYYHYFGKQTILQKAIHFLHENNLMTPTWRKIFISINMESLKPGIDTPTIKSLERARTTLRRL